MICPMFLLLLAAAPQDTTPMRVILHAAIRHAVADAASRAPAVAAARERFVDVASFRDVIHDSTTPLTNWHALATAAGPTAAVRTRAEVWRCDPRRRPTECLPPAEGVVLVQADSLWGDVHSWTVRLSVGWGITYPNGVQRGAGQSYEVRFRLTSQGAAEFESLRRVPPRLETAASAKGN